MDHLNEYYLPRLADIKDAPMLNWGEDNNKFYRNKPVILVEQLEFNLADPEPNHPVMVDYHYLFEGLVISKKIKNIIEQLNISGIQLLPAKIKVDENKCFDYWLLHIYHLIKDIIDLEKSVFDNSAAGGILYMEKISFKEKALREIPLEDRLIFRLEEYSSKTIFHVSIVDKIMAVEPVGITFVSVQELDN